jgi:hypothetical protein
MQRVRGRSSGAEELRSSVAHVVHLNVVLYAMAVVVQGRTAIGSIGELEVRTRLRTRPVLLDRITSGLAS